MTLYDELVLVHYRFEVKHLEPSRAMVMACRAATNALDGYHTLEQMNDRLEREYVAEMRNTDKQNMEKLCARHPEHAEALRREFAIEWRHRMEKAECGCDWDSFSSECIKDPTFTNIEFLLHEEAQ